MPHTDAAVPLRFIVTPRAEAESDAIEEWLKSLPFGGEEAAQRFSETLDRELPALCADLAQRFATGNNLPRPDPAASVAFARPTYKHPFTTASGGKRKRRQTTGVYILYYDLPNPSTLQVIALRHGASEPLTAWLDPTNDIDE